MINPRISTAFEPTTTTTSQAYDITFDVSVQALPISPLKESKLKHENTTHDVKRRRVAKGIRRWLSAKDFAQHTGNNVDRFRSRGRRFRHEERWLPDIESGLVWQVCCHFLVEMGGVKARDTYGLVVYSDDDEPLLLYVFWLSSIHTSRAEPFANLLRRLHDRLCQLSK